MWTIFSSSFHSFLSHPLTMVQSLPVEVELSDASFTVVTVAFCMVVALNAFILTPCSVYYALRLWRARSDAFIKCRFPKSYLYLISASRTYIDPKSRFAHIQSRSPSYSIGSCTRFRLPLPAASTILSRLLNAHYHYQPVLPALVGIYQLNRCSISELNQKKELPCTGCTDYDSNLVSIFRAPARIAPNRQYFPSKSLWPQRICWFSRRKSQRQDVLDIAISLSRYTLCLWPLANYSLHSLLDRICGYGSLERTGSVHSMKWYIQIFSKEYSRPENIQWLFKIDS